MTKITFEFDTCDENFEYHELQCYQNAEKLARTLNDILGKVKSWNKWDERGSIPVEEIHDTIYQILNDNNINMIELGY